MPATPENSQRNMRTLAAQVRARLGLSDVMQSWTYAQRSAYNQALAAEVLKYPNSFTSEFTRQAQIIIQKPLGSLADTSFSWTGLTDAAFDNAATVLPSPSSLNKLLWVAIAAVAVLLFLRLPPANPARA